MRTKVNFILFFFYAQVVFSQQGISANSGQQNFEDIAVNYRFDNERGLPSYVQFSKESNIQESVFFQSLFNAYDINSQFDFSLLYENKDQLGQIHRTYAQFFDGIKVVYSVLKTHSQNGKVKSFNGNFIKEVPEVTSPSINKETAFQKALNFIGAESYYGELTDFYSYELKEKNGSLRYLPNYLSSNKKNSIILCYEFNLYAKNPFSRTLVYVNALTGEIEFSESQLHDGGNSKGVALTAYSDTQNIITDSTASSFRLRDSTRGKGVFTYNALRSRIFINAVDFTDNDNFWNNVNANLDQYATDAHWGTQQFYDYLDSVFQRNSIDDSGFALKSYVHVDNNLVNAFWDGQRMSYGDGNGTTFSPLSSLDIVGHEITHGLTDFSSDLIYANESGALNESFSDIFGTTLEFWARPNRANWLVGEDIGNAFRSMVNPKQLGSPDTYNGQFWINQNCIPTSSNDQCGVHSNSGVQNKWFYLLAQGGIGVNDHADSFNVSGIGIQKAEQIAYRNLTVYLSPSSNFDEARFFGIISAIDLFGACSPEVEATTNAWHAVGVGKPYSPGVNGDFGALKDTAFCFSPVDIQFVSTGNNVQQFRWFFGNGDSSLVRNPIVHFNTQGVFDVTLIADGGTCGSDTVLKTNYIIVDSTISCAHFMSDTIQQTITDCNGRLFDSGGLNGNYELNQNQEITMFIQSADFIVFDFKKLGVETGNGFSCNKDYIEFFDGQFSPAKSLGRFCANHLPPGNRLVTSSNSVRIKFKSDRLNAIEGFLIEWSCGNSILPPVADFDVNRDTTCSGLVEFHNLSTNGYITQDWIFGDGKISSFKNPIHEYKSNGSFDVSLIVTNSVGSDTITKTAFITVDRPIGPNSKNDTFCLNQHVGFRMNSSGTIAWYRDSTLNSVFTGDSISLGTLQRDTTLFVKETAQSPSFVGGKMLNTGPGVFSNDNDFMLFDVHQPIVIEAILFFSNRSGLRTLDIRNKHGEVVQTKDIFIPGNPLFVTVNIPLDADTSYRISISDRENGLFKNTSGASFPYQISNLVTLKGSNLGLGTYPYFYRWQVRAQNCVSSFKTVTGIIDTTCLVTGIEDVALRENNHFLLFPNPVKEQLRIEIANFSSNQNYDILIYSAPGQLVYLKENIKREGAEQVLNIDFSAYAPGLYFVQLKNEQFIQTKKLIKSE